MIQDKQKDESYVAFAKRVTDAYEKIPEPIDEIKGMTIAICGQVKKDKFKNEKKLYSNSGTKLYVLSNHKVASTKFDDKRNKKL